MTLQALLSRRKASGKELAFFTSQLALLLDSGTSLTEALAALRDQTDHPALREAIEQAEEDVKGGKLLSSALERHPRLFPKLLTSMVRVGETGGFLTESLQRTSQFLLLRQEVLSKVQAALAYPVVLVAVSSGVVIFLITAVLPKFIKVFEGHEDILPLPTKMLMALSGAVTGYWYVFVAVAIGLIAGAVLGLRSPAGKRLFDRAILRLPLVGSLCRLSVTSRLLRTFGVLIESGVPLLDAVAVTRRTIGNTEFVRFFDTLEETVQQGGTLSDAFRPSPLFPSAIKQMVTTGEMTGNSGKIMIKMAEYYEGQVTLRLKSLTAAIEPLVLLVMGSVVGFIALSLFMPLFRMARTVT